MGIFTLEHSRAAYRADFALYGCAITLLAGFLVMQSPRTQSLPIAAISIAGLASWSIIEYLLHRFILHGVQPFKSWHAEHHRRPTALIYAPTILSATLIFTLVFLPARLVSNLWWASAFTLGVLSGYLAYAITHHATHHWGASRAWLQQRKRWHALHHQRRGPAGCYGVTTSFWDRVFGSDKRESP
jgi:cyclopropane-fatty-acyl-phospholipid synthase